MVKFDGKAMDFGDSQSGTLYLYNPETGEAKAIGTAGSIHVEASDEAHTLRVPLPRLASLTVTLSLGLMQHRYRTRTGKILSVSWQGRGSAEQN